MKIIALIPARLQSERFPEKLLQDLNGKPVILRTYESVSATGVFDEVVVATGDEQIAEVILNGGGEVFVNRRAHPSGTDRIAEAAEHLEADIVVNIQGDEPFVSLDDMRRIRETFEADSEKQIDILSFCRPITRQDEFMNPDSVKVVTGPEGFALYFSRAPIPYPRDGRLRHACRHIGIYAFRRNVLRRVAQLPPSRLEQIEKLENLRFLENGYRIKILETRFPYAGIDTPEDLEKARKQWK